MLNNERFIFRTLKSISEKKGYCFSTHSYDWIVEIRDEDRIFRLTGYTFDINPPSSILIARDKYATDSILQNILPESRIIPSAFIPCAWKEPYIGTTRRDILEHFVATHNFPLVLKDSTGSRGDNVYLVKNQAELEEQLEYFESIQCDAILAPYIRAKEEIRIILLDGNVQLIYRKRASSGWKFNLSQGATTIPVGISEQAEFSEEIGFARTILKELWLRFVSCDFLITDTMGIRFLEVNGWVCVDRFVEQHPEYIEDLERMYEEALEKSFVHGE